MGDVSNTLGDNLIWCSMCSWSIWHTHTHKIIWKMRQEWPKNNGHSKAQHLSSILKSLLKAYLSVHSIVSAYFAQSKRNNSTFTNKVNHKCNSFCNLELYTICNFPKIHLFLPVCVQKLKMSIIGSVLGQRTFLHIPIFMKVWFRVILKRFLGIKGSNLQQVFFSCLAFSWSCCIFVLGLGLYGQKRKYLAPHPPLPNYAQNCHF